MPRNRANLTVRYPDAFETWNQAIDNGGLVLHFREHREAIAANFRLQRYRKAYRDELAGDEVSVYDRFKVRVPPGEAMIIIEPIPQFRAASITTLAGGPLTDDPQPLDLEENDGPI